MEIYENILKYIKIYRNIWKYIEIHTNTIKEYVFECSFNPICKESSATLLGLEIPKALLVVI